MSWEICKMRKNCIICKRPIFKSERYFRTYGNGKSVCIHCLKDAYESMQSNKVWIEKNEDYKIVETKADGGYGCTICEKTVTASKFIMVFYSYSVRSWRGWVTRNGSCYVCERCLANFVNSLTKDELETSEANRFERAIITL